MEYIYTFVGGHPDYVWLSKGAFYRQFGLTQALGYLERIRGTLAHEAKQERCKKCFYTGLRHAFADIDGLGKLYNGAFGPESTAPNAIAFGIRYLGWINDRYKNLFGLLFDMYRHGLMHTHLIRTARYKKNGRWYFLGWAMTDDRQDHLALRTDGRRTLLIVSVPQLVDDTISAIDRFGSDLRAAGPNSRLLSRFKRGYQGTSTTLREPEPLPPVKKAISMTRTPKRLRLKEYSRPGIDWIRRNT